VKRRICSFDIVVVPENAYVLTDAAGEIYQCNARCLGLWSLTLAAKPGLAEELMTQSLKLNTPNLEELQFDSIVELARWAAANALQMSIVRISQ
jgi:hypothetical protein